MNEHLYKLINDKSTPFLAIERLLNSQSITDDKIAEYLALRKDAPQYILEWISMTVTDHAVCGQFLQIVSFLQYLQKT